MIHGWVCHYDCFIQLGQNSIMQFLAAGMSYKRADKEPALKFYI